MYSLFSFTIRFIVGNVCVVCSYVSILYELNVVLSELRSCLNRCRLAAPALYVVSWLGKRGAGCRGEAVGVCRLVGIQHGVA